MVLMYFLIVIPFDLLSSLEPLLTDMIQTLKRQLDSNKVLFFK